MMHKAVLLDTSFFLRFLNDEDPLFNNADGYFRYFIQREIAMVISTISIAEYCVKGNVNELPLRNLQILPFNIDHAKKTGELARYVFDNKNSLRLSHRNIIPNDTKLFAQANQEKAIEFYLSADSESRKIYQLLVDKPENGLNFTFIDLITPHHEVFGLLNL